MAVYDCTLTPLSPIHIGDKVGELRPTEFYVENGQVHVVSEPRLVEALAELGLVENFLNYADGGFMSLQDFIGKQNATISRRLRARIATGGIPVAIQPPHGGPGKDPRIGSFRPLIRDPLTGRPYIPGSSIKGALRNQQLVALLMRHRGPLDQVMGGIRTEKTSNKKQTGAELDELMRLPSRAPGFGGQGPHRDWFRALKVSDAYCDEDGTSHIVEVKVISLNKGGVGHHFGARGRSICVECLKPGKVFKFTITVDDWLLEEMRRSAGTELFELSELLVNPVKVEKLHEEEEKFWTSANLEPMRRRQQEYRSAGANLRIGWGSGYLGTTVGLCLRNEERMAVKERFYPDTPYTVFPNSRKVVVNGTVPADALGWCKVAIQER